MTDENWRATAKLGTTEAGTASRDAVRDARRIVLGNVLAGTRIAGLVVVPRAITGWLGQRPDLGHPFRADRLMPSRRTA